MELNITDLVRDLAPHDYSASRIELGDDAGKITWRAACEDAPDMLRSVYDREAFHAYFRGFGAWSDEELAVHTEAEDMALMLQFIAADIRDAEFINAEPFTPEWWTEYEAECQRGTLSARLGRGVEPGTVYYCIEE